MKKKVLNILTAVFALIFCVSAFLLIRYYVNSNEQEKVYDQLSQVIHQAEETSEEAPGEEVSPYTTVIGPDGNPMQILRQFASLYEMNPDIAGWMRIEGTVVDYPVMYKPAKKDFYLRKNFHGEKATHGCLYIQETCSVFPQSDNMTIYGHNMRDGSMFGCLKNYRKKSFWESHPVIRLTTLTEEAEYEIFAVFATTSSVGKGFKYHYFIDAETVQDAQSFIDTCKELSIYDTGITPTPGDKFITLSTCEDTLVNGRLVVVARKCQ